MIFEIIILTLIIEGITICGRIVFGSKKESIELSIIKLRIHHGYIGLLLILLYSFISNDWLMIFGIALFLSDSIHHFVVLPLWVGKTEFP